MILLTTRQTEAACVKAMQAAKGASVPLSLFQTMLRTEQLPGRQFFPTVPGALRAAMDVPSPAFLVVNCVPTTLAPMPLPYVPNEADLSKIMAKPLPTQPGQLGVDFAIAFALSQLAVAVKLHRIGQAVPAAYFVECAGLSAGCVCSVASAEIMEQMNAAAADPDSFPLPDGILWPDGVSEWLCGFGFPRDEGA